MGTVRLRGPLTRNGNWEELGGVMILNWENGEEGIGVALLGILSFVFAERWACNPAFAYTEDWLFGRAPSPVDGNKLRIGQAVQLLRLFLKKKNP